MLEVFNTKKLNVIQNILFLAIKNSRLFEIITINSILVQLAINYSKN